MADCSLSFNITKRPETIRPGDEFQGEVVVKVDAACRCDGLKLAAEWRTSGKGNPASGQTESQTLFTGQWEPGEHRYRFTYRAPVGPLTYEGELLQIRWSLLATADIPWAIDPKANAPFVLSAAPSESAPYFFGPLYKPPAPETKGVSETAGGGKLVKKPMSLGVKIAVGAFVLLMGSALIFAVPAMAIMFAPFILYFVIKKAMVKNKLGEPDVRLFSNPARPGEEVSIVARLNPLKEVKLGKVYAELIGHERVVSGSGKHSRTHTHPLHTWRHMFPVEARELRAGENMELRARMTLPPNAALTFAAGSNNIEWNVKLSIELLGWPDWEKTLPLTVRPGALPADAGGFARRD
jgi:hypothetical protein